MGRIGYTTAQKREAVALAVVVGAETAGERLGIQGRTVRNWCDQAGRKPADAISAADWNALGEMARAQVQSDLMAGKLTPVQAATVAAIADRNAAKPEAPLEPPTAAEQWGDELENELHKRYGKDACLALVLALPWLEAMPEDAEGPSVADTLKHIASLGEDLHAVRARRVAEQHAADMVNGERARHAALWAAQGYPAAECWTRAADGPPGLDAKALELLDQPKGTP